ncbi:MAG: hypothetical protein QOH61_1733 [Chloroflexota bacterium]|jgi:uncharacterized membrane protein|nr:hypothetical protein [Chloroflexota bacterium]
MPFSVASVEVLLLGALLLGATLLLSAAARHHLSLGRRRASLVLRTIVLSALVLALAGFRLDLPVDRLTTVFVVDLSDSVGAVGHSAALDFLRKALDARRGDDQAAVVAFGRDALVERLPAELDDIDRIASVPTKSATDIGGALRLASALFPDETQKRIVLVSDGNDTTGAGQSEAALAASRGVQIETYEVGLGGADEVIVQRLHTPATARVGEEIEAEVTISSNVAQSARVLLFGDGAAIGSQQVNLQVGLTRVVFTVRATEAGFHTFRALVEAGRDTFGQNNRADSDTVVKGDPRILLVSGEGIVAANLLGALRAERQQVTQITADAMPRDLATLAGYDSIVLVDVPATDLGADRMKVLQSYVRDVGRGLVMVGGKESYGAGGYARTALEEALPVNMDVRDRNRQPDVALVVVIDKSGSMDACHCNTANRDTGTAIGGVRKVDIGKEAILRAVSALTQRDQFGVVAFDENAHWIINTQPLSGVGDVEAQIAGINPLGTTNVFAGLAAAVEQLEHASAERRHIVLLTDGWSSSGEYTELIARMKAANITLSAVGAGGGSAPFLANLAEQGGGRYYSAANPASIPDIFLKETQQVSGQQIVEEPFFPIQTGDSPILTGLDQGLPQLLGYNGTTVKSAAQSVLVTSRDDPLLAQWQYGLGRAVAWTSDASGTWAKNWVAWTGFNRFFSQLVRWTFPGEESGGLEAEFITDGDQTRLRLHSSETDGTPRNFYDTMVRLTSPEFDPVAMRLDQVAPGVYEAPLGILSPGAYALRIDQTKAGSTPLGRTVVLVAPTPAEYRLLGTNQRLLAALRGGTGGLALTGDEAPLQVWAHDLGTTTASRDLWPWLLLLALILWPLDVAIRRVSIGRRDLVAGRAWAGDRWRGWRGPSGRTAPVGGMLAAKERASGTRARGALLRGGGTLEEASLPLHASAPDRAATATTTAAAPSADARRGAAPVPASPGATRAAAANSAGNAAAAPSADAGRGTAPTATPPTAPLAGTPPPATTPAGAPAAAPAAAQGPTDTLARLRDAKQRARR